MGLLKFLLCILLSIIILLFSIKAVYSETYNRSAHFGSGWIDEDGDCQDTRQEVLIRDSLIPVVLSEDECDVIYGLWACPYTGAIIHDPSVIDIDHVVPLKEAWESGAEAWTKEQRVAYANDLNNPNHLIISLNKANRAKGAKDPSQWLPEENQCEYVNNWIQIKSEYKLGYDYEEIVWIVSNAFTCFALSP